MTSILPSASMRELLEKRLSAYASQVADSPEALTYLESRKITSKTIQAFRVGFVADPVVSGDHKFVGRLALPYLTVTGPVGMKFRAITPDDTPKYLTDKGHTVGIYNAHILASAEAVVVCEGEFDTLSVAEAGLPAVGIPGVNALRSEWVRIFYQRRVRVVAQGDTPGREFAESVAALTGGRVVEMPEGEDANSMLVQRGPQWLRERIVNG